MTKNIAIWLILSAIGISSCSDQHVYVYVSNESTADSVVQLELFINKEKKLAQAFRYTQVIPDYDEFVVKNNVSIPRNEKYVFIPRDVIIASYKKMPQLE